MIYKIQFCQFLNTLGYTPLASNHPDFLAYYKKEQNFINVIQVIQYREGVFLTEEIYHSIQKRIEDVFQENGQVEVHRLSLILGHNIEAIKRFSEKDYFCWIIDDVAEQLVIYENKASDFYGMKEKIENFLTHAEDYIVREQKVTFNEQQKKSKKIQRKEIPIVTTLFVLINVLLFVLLSSDQYLHYTSGVTHILENKEYGRLFTAMFLHGDVNHLFSNMIILYFLGELVEKSIGSIKFTVVYLLSGIGGNILSCFWEVMTRDFSDSLGASGAVFGVIGVLLYLVLFQKGKTKQITTSRMLFMVAFSIYSGLAGENINNVAHIGGLLIGFLFAYVLHVGEQYKKKRS